MDKYSLKLLPAPKLPLLFSSEIQGSLSRPRSPPASGDACVHSTVLPASASEFLLPSFFPNSSPVSNDEKPSKHRLALSCAPRKHQSTETRAQNTSCSWPSSYLSPGSWASTLPRRCFSSTHHRLRFSFFTWNTSGSGRSEACLSVVSRVITWV